MGKIEEKVTKLPAKPARGIPRQRKARPSGVVEVAPIVGQAPIVEVERPECWSFDIVEEWLVEAVSTWWRQGGGGGSPFASDGPWNLIVAEWNDWGAHDKEEERPRPKPLTRAMIARMQEATEWLLLVPEQDRRVLCMALRQLAMGKEEPDWKRMLRPLGLRRGAHGLKRRYTQGITAICTKLNGELLVQGGGNAR